MKRKIKPIFFVCSAIKDTNLLSKIIEAFSVKEAEKYFANEYKIKPETILGPFYKKRSKLFEKNCNIQFRSPSETIRAVYNGWHVTGMILSAPQNSAYLFFDKKIDGTTTNKPGFTVVNLKELKEIK